MAADNQAAIGRRVGDTVLELSGLVKHYGDVQAVSGIDLVASRGEVVGLLGPNGSGKTTTIECIVGLRRPTAGTVRLLGHDPASERSEITSRVGVQPQSASLLGFQTVRETLSLFASFHRDSLSVGSVLHDTGLEAVATRQVRRLSGGQLRRLLLAVALIGDPEVLILDEPSAGLDPAARQSLWAVINSLRSRGKTVLLSTHHMDEASYLCDRIAILVRGRIAAEGVPDELVRQHSRLSYIAFTVPAGAAAAELSRIAGGEYTTRPVDGGLRVSVSSEEPDAIMRRLTFSAKLGAKDYSVRTSSLEDVFLNVAEDGGHDGEHR